MVLVTGDRDYADVDKPFDWPKCQAFLKKADFRDTLRNFDNVNIEKWRLEDVEPVLRHKDMNYEDKKRWGGGTAYIMEWLSTTVAYHHQEKLLAPNMNSLQTWKEEFAGKQESVKQAQEVFETQQKKVQEI